MKKFKKNFILLAVILTFSVVLVACGGSETPPADNQPEGNVGEDINGDVVEETPSGDVVRHTDDENKVATLNGELAGLEGPVYLTSVGQSADASMLDALMNKVGIDYTFDSTASASDISGSETVIIAAGASSKGLGAAGISADDEEARAQEILTLCEEEGITVIMAHLGGVARRGELSDQFSDMVLDYSDGILVVEDGNDDGKFTDYAESNNIPIVLVNTIADSMEPLNTMFGN